MFFKNMEQVNMEIDDINGYVSIKQINEANQEQVVTIPPDQIDILISWLTEAKVYSTRVTSSTD